MYKYAVSVVPSCSTKLNVELASFNWYTFQSWFSAFAKCIVSFASGLNLIFSANNWLILGTLNALKLTLFLLTYPALGKGLNLLSVIPKALTFDVVLNSSSVLSPVGFLRNLFLSSISISIISSSLASGVIS